MAAVAVLHSPHFWIEIIENAPELFKQQHGQQEIAYTVDNIKGYAAYKIRYSAADAADGKINKGAEKAEEQAENAA